MAKISAYQTIVVESFDPSGNAGKHGDLHVRPAKGQFYPQSLRVECSRSITRDFPVGTKFRIQVKLTDREGEGEYLYSSYKWPFEVVSEK